MHVCMITSEFPPKSGGVGYYVYYLSRKLKEKGHDVTVVTRGSVGGTTSEVIDDVLVFKVSYYPIYPLNVAIHGAILRKFMRSLEHKFHLIHFHTPLVPSIKTSLPTITTVHTPMKVDARYHEVADLYSLAERTQCALIYPVVESKLFGVSNMLTAVSLSVAKELEEYGLSANDITIVGNGVDEKRYFPTHNRKCSERYILYTGVLRARKGLFDLVECAKIVCERFSDIRFVISGRGPFRSKMEKMVDGYGLKDRFVFLGYVSLDRLVKTYQDATVHIIPSHYEGLPTVLLEAMACGLPVVATDVGGNSEVIASGVNGFLVPAKQPKIMAETVSKLLDNETLREKIGAAARETIEKHYSWDRITDNFLKSYEILLQK